MTALTLALRAQFSVTEVYWSPTCSPTLPQTLSLYKMIGKKVEMYQRHFQPHTSKPKMGFLRNMFTHAYANATLTCGLYYCPQQNRLQLFERPLSRHTKANNEYRVSSREWCEIRATVNEFSTINLSSSEDSTKGPAPDCLATQEYVHSWSYPSIAPTFATMISLSHGARLSIAGCTHLIWFGTEQDSDLWVNLGFALDLRHSRILFLPAIVFDWLFWKNIRGKRSP
jgi:hypothetical protein